MAFTLSVIKNSTSAYNIVVPGGFEPPQTEPKSVVLPLHHIPRLPGPPLPDIVDLSLLKGLPILKQMGASELSSTRRIPLTLPVEDYIFLTCSP